MCSLSALSSLGIVSVGKGTIGKALFRISEESLLTPGCDVSFRAAFWPSEQDMKIFFIDFRDCKANALTVSMMYDFRSEGIVSGAVQLPTARRCRRTRRHTVMNRLGGEILCIRGGIFQTRQQNG
ncbi:hypothetical protein BDV19DRAFT_39038 [Aspergillus venezuelensis]